ncbi:AMP-binding protein [Amycolatopsis anabasis]|uniref:AMP-binding protein n=1 Tax=Amycolatopsis anabasis TaxID=1840409 RepID=UPI0015D3F507|nr:AMP-binding protein [Amycolatopsis anabasis]
MGEPSFFLTRILEALRGEGEKTAFRWHDRVLSYRAALGVLGGIHDALATEGIGRGELLAIVGGNRPETLLAQLAAQLRGTPVLPVTASSSLPDRLAALAAAEATTLVIDPDREPRKTRELIEAVRPDRVLSLGPTEPWMPHRAKDLLSRSAVDPKFAVPPSVRMVFPSGGTTGTPKLIGHSGIYEGMARIFAPDPAGPQRILLVAPLSHLTGNCAALGALLCGDTLVLHDGFDAGAVLRSIAADRITSLTLTPPRLAALLDHPDLPGTDVSSVRSLSLGASPLPPDLLRRALEVFGPVVGQGYGLTEAPMIASIAAPEFDGHPHRLASVGRIVPGMSAKIDGDGGTGEVLVRGLALMDGYHGQPELDAAAFTGDGWLRTGDIGRFDAEGYLYLLDRANDVIVTGEHGTKIYSNVVESALAAHPRVRQAAVFGVPDPRGGEAVHAVVVSANPAPTAEELRTHLRAHFDAEHFVPATIEFAESLPLTPIGKVDKKSLRAQHPLP